jgi:hypothetical protein
LIVRGNSDSLQTLSVTGIVRPDCLSFDLGDEELFTSLINLTVSTLNKEIELRTALITPFLQRAPHLQHLTVHNCVDIDHDPTWISMLAQLCPDVSALDLTGGSLNTTRSLHSLARLDLRSLQLPRIDIVGEDEILDIDDLVVNLIVRLRSLEELALTDNDQVLTDYHVGVLLNLPSLRTVRLDNVASVMGDFIHQLPPDRSDVQLHLKLIDFCIHAGDLMGLSVPEFLKLLVIF